MAESKFGGVPVQSTGSRFGGVPVEGMYEQVISTPAAEKEPGFWGKTAGAAEALLSLGTDVASGIPNLTMGGLRAMWDAGLRGASGYGQPTQDSQRIVEESAIFPSYQPRTEYGQDVKEAAGMVFNYPFEKLEQLATYVQDQQIKAAQAKAERSGEAYDPPGASVPTLIQTLPDIIGSLMGVEGGRMLSRGPDVRRIQKIADEAGIDLNAPYPEQVGQVSASGERQAGTGMEGIDQIAPEVRQRRESERERIGAIFDEGREGGAQIPSTEAMQLGPRMENSIRGIVTDDFPAVQRILQDAKKLPLPEKWGDLFNKNWSETPLNEVMELRMNINSNLPSDVLSPEYKALSTMKGEVDGFLQDAFEKDMINGSPQALERWREGFGEWNEFKDLFDDNRTIRRIWQDELNADQIKRLIFNKNAVNPGADSGALVSKLKTILGEDSPQINTLRMTVLDDLMRPLTRRDPDLKRAATQWDDFKQNNRSLISELFPDELVTELDGFADLANAIEETAPASMKKQFSLPRVISVFTVGHSLARGAARRAFGERIASALIDPNRENIVMSEILGYNPRSPLLSPVSLQRVSEIEALRQDEDER